MPSMEEFISSTPNIGVKKIEIDIEFFIKNRIKFQLRRKTTIVTSLYNGYSF